MQRQPLGFYQDSAVPLPLKASLFSKLHQVQAVLTQLERVANLPGRQRQAWVTAHRQPTLELFQHLQQYLHLDLNQDEVDQEMLGLLTEYSRALQACAAYIHTLFPEERLEG